MKARTVFLGTMGGIKINGNCEVLDKNFHAIKGLYAAGDCAAGEVWGDPPIGGIGHSGIAFSQGFIAADHASEFIKK